MKPRYLHFWVSFPLCAALIPILRSQHLPLRFDWGTLAIAFWLVLAAESIFLSAILCAFGLPYDQICKPLWERYRQNPFQIVILLAYFMVLAWATSVVKAVILTVATLAFVEFISNRRKKSESLRHDFAAVFLPAGYLFVGFLIVFAYNCAIVSVRFSFAADPALAAIDRWLMHGYSVWDMTRWALRALPLTFFRSMEFLYFGMFPQIGATIILVALCEGRARALQFVGTILMAYYLALAIFYVWPSQGPYYLTAVDLPTSLQSYTIQKTLIARALALWHHQPISQISTDYFIGLPCMHIAQPLIVLWFLRRWPRMVVALAIYDVAMTIAVLMLEMHYVVDVLAGVLVACVAIMITGREPGKYFSESRSAAMAG
jgi:hypothetical protein